MTLALLMQPFGVLWVEQDGVFMVSERESFRQSRFTGSKAAWAIAHQSKMANIEA